MATKDALMRAVDTWLATDTPGPLALDLHGLEERLNEIVAPLEPECPWRRAVEWVRESGTQETDG
jgi:hypothetical protein